MITLSFETIFDNVSFSCIEPVNIFIHNSLGKGMKSILFKLVFQSDTKTLEDKEVNPIIDEIISVVGNNFGGKLRA